MVTPTDPKKVLVFNPLKTLVAIVQSTTAAARIFETTPPNIYYACSGATMSCSGFYFRHLPDDIEVTLEDLGTLKVDEFDKLCGVKRKLYPNRSMSRKGMKYKKSVYKPKKSKTKDEKENQSESC